MKIIADNKIPYLEGILEPFGSVSYLDGSSISRESIKDADALIIRTRTHCNKELLHNTAIKFIGTATIGTDHIDTAYCEEAGINWVNAPGCNAESVNQYVTAALLEWAHLQERQLDQLCLGIIGVGNVGSRVAQSAKALGMKIMLNDPPRARAEGPARFNSIEEIMIQADVISLHVPLQDDGIDKTRGFITHDLLNTCQNKPLLINTCRGEVIEDQVILEGLRQQRISDIIIDCWNHEPLISTSLLEQAFIATPHIAGYSRDGKANGTAIVVQQLASFFGLPLVDWYPPSIEEPQIKTIFLNGNGLTEQEIIRQAVNSTYDIWQDDRKLREHIEAFEKQRGDYPIRREYPAYEIITDNISQEGLSALRALGFQLKTR